MTIDKAGGAGTHFALVSAPTVTEFRSLEEIRSRAVQEAALQPQLGVLNVAAILERWGDTPHFLDANAEYLAYAAGGADIDGFAHHLAETAARSNADVYGFSSICSTFPLSLRVARALKEIRPYATVLFGGPQVSVVDQAVMRQFPFVDFVLRGEVEESLPVFLKEATGDYQFSKVPGLTFRDGGTVCRTPNAPVIEDLDALPAPSYHLSQYLNGAKAASIELGRGCPFSCTFCSTNDFFRRRFRLRSPERVLAEMRSIAGEYGIRHFELVHDMFTVDRKRVVAFCRAMRDSGESFTWDCSARTDCVDEELLEEMAASGCRGLFFGIESGSVRMQRIIDKDLDPAKAQAMLRACERLGIRTTASLICGFPQEQWTDVEDTLDVYMQSARCARSHPQINLLAPLAGTPMHTLHAHELALDDYCSDMSHQGLSQADDDVAMIRAHPDIFPNFYMIPNPALDRAVLSELRDFLSMAVAHFRWLLCAVAQRTGLLQFHREWRHWRREALATDVPGEVRRFYALAASRIEFLRFLRAHPLQADPVIDTLLQVEETLLATGDLSANATQEDGLQLAEHVCILALDYDLTQLIEAIAQGVEATAERCWYATRADSKGTVRLHRISSFHAKVLRLHQQDRAEAVAPILRQQFGLGAAHDVSALLADLSNMLQAEGWLQAESESNPALHETVCV